MGVFKLWIRNCCWPWTVDRL